MLSAPPDDVNAVDLRLARRSNQAITDVTFSDASPGLGLAPRTAPDTRGNGLRHQIGTEALTADRERERHAMAQLVDQLSRNPGQLLERLVDVVTGVYGYGTAAVAMTNGDPLHWDAAAGPLADCPRWIELHREVVERRAAGIQTRSPSVECDDAWAIPLHHAGATAGVLWVATPPGRGAPAPDDERAIRVLAQMASSGWITWSLSESARRAAIRRGELLAMVGHELRNPLNTIVAAAALLGQGLTAGAEGHAAVDVIARQSQFMSRLVADLFDIARLEHRKLDLQLTSLDLRAMVVETLATRRQELERHGHTLSLDLGEEPLCVDADPMRLSQVLSNLVDNAIKYTARGGRIVVSLCRAAGEIALTVTDSGHGLPADQLVAIFEPFAQLERAERVGGGLGLGLPLARSLAELHGGSLNATSPGPGLGSSFVVTLPARARQAPGVLGSAHTRTPV